MIDRALVGVNMKKQNYVEICGLAIVNLIELMGKP